MTNKLIARLNQRLGQPKPDGEPLAYLELVRLRNAIACEGYDQPAPLCSIGAPCRCKTCLRERRWW